MTTIAAIATPNAPGGIAVIRISGERAFEVAEKIFVPVGGKKVADMRGYTCAYGEAFDGEERLDDCILTVFRAPHSFTGEDTAEISCHGGIYVTRRILRAALANGAVMAQAGEFTKRAFLNGKIDLTQAESVMDIISAKGERELKMAENIREGAAYKAVRKISDRLMNMLGSLAAWTDYPDEDIPEVEPETMRTELENIRAELESLIRNYDSGRILREGVSTVIVGRPNVGKSTLFNALSGCERSIVTDIAGTTRDAVEETVKLGDVTLRLMDTAGIRETSDKIEEIGVNIAQKAIESAELVIAVFDGSEKLSDDDTNIINKINFNNSVAVVNKNDLSTVIDITELEKHFKHIVYLSAKENSGTDELCACIEDIFRLNEPFFNDVTVANERQKKCVDVCLENVEKAVEAIECGEMLDAVNVLIDYAEQSLLELIGEKITDAVVDEVFSRFCVGK